MAPHSSTFAWKIPWMEEPGRLQSVGSLRVRHEWATSLSLFTSRIGEGNGNPLQCSCLENPRDGGAWWAAVYGVAQSQTWLTWLSSSMATSSRKPSRLLVRFWTLSLFSHRALCMSLQSSWCIALWLISLAQLLYWTESFLRVRVMFCLYVPCWLETLYPAIPGL